ncbi:UPF0415 protein C7orf25 homolog [Ornithodoros turicata]|uniref:UPF0415 protein C7orf25 homolog n=1 Tax=Ornithodoros turicata TaxID=34597 RepID=UPI0031392F60
MDIEEAKQKVLDKINDAEEILRRCDTIASCQGRSKLRRKIQAEIKFLRSLYKSSDRIKEEHLRCTNLAYLSAVVTCSLSSAGFVDVLKPFAFPEGYVDQSGRYSERVIVDVVAGHGSIWYKVVARNPRALLVSSMGDGEYGRKTILDQLQEMTECSKHHPHLYHAPHIKLWSTLPVCDSLRSIVEGVGAEIIDTENASGTEANPVPPSDAQEEHGSSSAPDQAFSLHINNIPENATLNLDVSTMIAYVSGLTNGRCHFKFQENILTEQAESERRSPVKPILDALFGGAERKLVCCQTAYDEFVKITGTLAGPGEMAATKKLLERVQVVPDEPSECVITLPRCGKVKGRSRVIFGTGVTLRAITVTANGGFLRAAHAKGIDFPAFVHESRALTEAKEKTAMRL